MFLTAHTGVQITNPPSVGGLTTADLLVILGIVISIFGMLLSAIGILLLRNLSATDARIDSVKSDNAADIAAMKHENTNALEAIWRELATLRAYIFGSPAPTTFHPPGRDDPPGT